MRGGYDKREAGIVPAPRPKGFYKLMLEIQLHPDDNGPAEVLKTNVEEALDRALSFDSLKVAIR